MAQGWIVGLVVNAAPKGIPAPGSVGRERFQADHFPYAGTHLGRSLIGALCPQSSCLSALIFSDCNTEIFQICFDNPAAEAPPRPGKRQLLILNNGSCHNAKTLNWHHFESVYLPPYSSDLNPIKRFWLQLKSDFFAGFFVRNLRKLLRNALP